MKQKFPALWAEAPASLRRDATPAELAGGFPCGPLDLQLFNELMFRLAELNAEVDYVTTQTGQTPSAGDTTQLWGAFKAVLATVPKISTNTTLYVRLDGSDTNDGSANSPEKAFATISAAIAYGTSRFSLAGGTLTIQLGTTGTYIAPGIVPQTLGTLVLRGDPNAQYNYVLQGNNPLFAQGVVNAIGLTLRNTGTTFSTVTASASGFVSLQNVTVDSTQIGLNHFGAGNGGIISVGAGCIVATSMSNLFAAVTTGNIQINASISIANTPNFPAGTAFASTCGVIGVASGATFVGTGATGPRYVIGLNGVISTNGAGPNFFPGNSPGVNNDGTGAYA